METDKITSGLAGLAGEYLVAAELCRRGWLAAITLRNSKGVDILVTNSTAERTATIQVKATQRIRKTWVLKSSAEELRSPNFFYVFVNLGQSGEMPDFHVVPSGVVADRVRKEHAEWLRTPGSKGQQRKDSNLRKFSDLQCQFRSWKPLERLLNK